MTVTDDKMRGKAGCAGEDLARPVSAFELVRELAKRPAVPLENDIGASTPFQAIRNGARPLVQRLRPAADSIEPLIAIVTGIAATGEGQAALAGR